MKSAFIIEICRRESLFDLPKLIDSSKIRLVVEKLMSSKTSLTTSCRPDCLMGVATMFKESLSVVVQVYVEAMGTNVSQMNIWVSLSSRN